MSEEQQAQQTNLEICKRLQALSAYRESENDVFEAISVLADALVYLSPQSFTAESGPATEARLLRVRIWIKQVELCLKMNKPKKAVQYVSELIQDGSQQREVAQLIKRLEESGVSQVEMHTREIECQH